jgi:hypothetical protein
VWLVLDPRISYEGLKQDYESDTSLLQSLEDTKDELYTEYATHYAQNPSPALSDDTVASTTTTPTSPSKFDFLGNTRGVTSLRHHSSNASSINISR